MAGFGRDNHVGGHVAGHIVVGNHNIVVGMDRPSAVSPVGAAGRPRPAPRKRIHLPAPAGVEPIGRDDELALLRDAVTAGGPAFVYGPRGIGKTALLRRLARQLDGTDRGLVFLGGAGHDLGDVVQGVFEACYDSDGYRPTPVELRVLLSEVRFQLLVDDVEVPGEDVETLLDTVPAAAVVLASTNQLLWGTGTAVRLSGLTRQAGLALVRRELGRELSASELAAAEAAWRRAGGVPLDLLRAVASGLQGAPGERADGVGTLVRDLAPSAHAVLALLCTLAATPEQVETPARLLPAATGDPAAVEAAADLVRAGLAEGDGTTYRVARDVIEGDAATPVLDADGVFATARALTGWLASNPPPRQVALGGALIAAVADLAVREGRPDLAVDLARAAAPRAALSLRWGAWRRILRSGLAAARAAGDERAEEYFTHEDAIRALFSGRPLAAGGLLGAGVGLWRVLGDGSGEATSDQAQVVTDASAVGGPPPSTADGAAPAPDTSQQLDQDGHAGDTGQDTTNPDRTHEPADNHPEHPDRADHTDHPDHPAGTGETADQGDGAGETGRETTDPDQHPGHRFASGLGPRTGEAADRQLDQDDHPADPADPADTGDTADQDGHAGDTGQDTTNSNRTHEPAGTELIDWELSDRSTTSNEPASVHARVTTAPPVPRAAPPARVGAVGSGASKSRMSTAKIAGFAVTAAIFAVGAPFVVNALQVDTPTTSAAFPTSRPVTPATEISMSPKPPSPVDRPESAQIIVSSSPSSPTRPPVDSRIEPTAKAVPAPGTPGVDVRSGSGAVAVTVTAPVGGGPVDRYEVAASNGAASSLDAPGTVTIDVPGCAVVSVTVTAVGPGGERDAAPNTAAGCTVPGPVADLAVTYVSNPGNIGDIAEAVVTWDPPADTGGGAVVYVVIVENSFVPSPEEIIVTDPTYRTGCCSGRSPNHGMTVAARNEAGTGPARRVSFTD